MCSADSTSGIRLGMSSVVYSSCNNLGVPLVKSDLARPPSRERDRPLLLHFRWWEEPSSSKAAGVCCLSGVPRGFDAVHS